MASHWVRLRSVLVVSISTWTLTQRVPPHWVMTPLYALDSPGSGTPFSSEFTAALTGAPYNCVISGMLIGAPSAPCPPPLPFCPPAPGAPGAPPDPFAPGAPGAPPPPAATAGAVVFPLLVPPLTAPVSPAVADGLIVLAPPGVTELSSPAGVAAVCPLLPQPSVKQVIRATTRSGLCRNLNKSDSRVTARLWQGQIP